MSNRSADRPDRRGAIAHLVAALAECFGEAVRAGEPMARHTTFGIGGPVTARVQVQSVDELAEVLSMCRRAGVPAMVLGGGSNVLFADEAMDLVVIVLAGELASMTWTGGHAAYVGAGRSLASAASAFAECGLEGLAWAAGIPGSVGGAVRGNAGAAGESMADAVASVDTVDRDGRRRTIAANGLDFGYRRSALLQRDLIVTGVTLRGRPGDAQVIRRTMRELFDRRRATQPVGTRNAGCVFRNPPEGPSAGALIDRCGLKGCRIGGAQVSGVHANFVVNLGEATAADVHALMRHVVATVGEREGVDLVPEIQQVPRERFEEGRS